VNRCSFESTGKDKEFVLRKVEFVLRKVQFEIPVKHSSGYITWQLDI
jgi:hypothetical protein